MLFNSHQKKYVLLFIIAGLLSSFSVSADEKKQNSPLTEQLLTTFNKLDKQYIHYCGNNNWKKGNWDNEKQCLQDGRTHIVYANKADGSPGIFSSRDKKISITFQPADKLNLLDAISEGASVYVNDVSHSHIQSCEDVGISKGEPVHAACSTVQIIHAFWGDNSEGDVGATVFHVFKSTGKRYRLLRGETKEKHKVQSPNAPFQWFVRY